MFLSFSGAKAILGARRANKKIGALGSDQRGVAAIEFALFGGLISVAMLNVTDISVYIYQRMQVEYAAEMAAQAAWKTCDSTQLPATTNCNGLTDALQNAVAGTSLGTRVTLQSGSPSEGYYCVNSSNALQYVSDVSSKPANCSAAGTPGLQPGDYITVQTTFPYAPMFPGITVTGAFTTPITKTAWMRLG
jgi:Flp pilus assembly protein TadG